MSNLGMSPESEEALLQLLEERREQWRANSELYTDGAGQTVRVHKRNPTCDESCVIHNPSDHVMRDFPTLWRDDRGIMERTCPHGVGHPDPDNMAFIAKSRGEEAAGYESVHGCDGCCTHGIPFSEWTEAQRVAIGLPSDAEVEARKA